MRDKDNDDQLIHGVPLAVWRERVAGLQVAVPRVPRDGILVSLQTLTLAASTRVIENRRVREDARAKAASLRRAAKEAKEAKAKVRGGQSVSHRGEKAAAYSGLE